MGEGLDLVPGIAGHVPAFGRLVLERVEVFGLARQQVEHHGVLEQAACVALAHEFLQVGPEQRGEDRVGLGVDERLHHCARVDLAQGRRLLSHKLHAGLFLLQELLEPQSGRLAVLVIRVDDRPFLFLELGRVRDEHRGLHVGRGPQPERVAIAVLPHDFVGQRLRGDKDDFALGGEVAHRQADVRREGAHQEAHLLARDEFLGHPYGVARVAVVVARDHLDLAAQDPSGLVDLLERELPAFFVGVEEGGEDLVAVELADLDRLGLGACAEQDKRGTERRDRKMQTLHFLLPSVLLQRCYPNPAAWPVRCSARRLTACRSAGRKILS